jgi:hypothetical protein
MNLTNGGGEGDPLYPSSKILPIPAATALAILLNAAFVGSASAHVKWFCAYDVAGQPRGLESVLCTDFEILVGLGALALLTGCLTEGTTLGQAVVRALNRVTAWCVPIPSFISCGLCVFLHRALAMEVFCSRPS